MKLETVTLHVRNAMLDQTLTLGWLRQALAAMADPPHPRWIALEPRAWMPQQDGQYRPGRIQGLTPLARELPSGPDALPLMAASLYLPDRWLHWIDAQPLSGLPARQITWSLVELPGAERMSGLLSTRDQVLPWQDRARFNLGDECAASTALQVEHYFHNGKRLAWRILP